MTHRIVGRGRVTEEQKVILKFPSGTCWYCQQILKEVCFLGGKHNN